MSNFAKGHGNQRTGYPRINLDLVARMHPRAASHGSLSWNCVGADGEDMGAISDIDLPEPTTILPNNALLTVIEFWLDGEDVQHQRYAVLAWHIVAMEAQPIVFGHEIADFEAYCCEQRLGEDVSFIFSMGQAVCADWESAQAEARRIIEMKRKIAEANAQRALAKGPR